MSKDPHTEGLAEFQRLVEGITPLPQDKRHFRPAVKTRQQLLEKAVQLQATSYFSDIYQPLLPVNGPMRWCREDVDAMELKRSRRGDPRAFIRFAWLPTN